MKSIYFVRHGQTVWNVENKICGATDIELTEFGHEQAIKTGEEILKTVCPAHPCQGNRSTYFEDDRNTRKRGYPS